MVAVLSSATVGAVLGSRRPRHPVGWLLLALGLSVVASGVAIGYASYALLARRGALPAAVWPAAYTDFSVVLWAACLGFILLLTPTGSPPSPRWRWWATVTVAAAAVAVVSTTLLPFDEPFRAVANPLAVDALPGPLSVASVLGWVVTGLSVPVGATSLVVRFRRARGVERLQLQWLVLAAGVTVVAALVLVALLPTGNEVLLGWASAVCVALLPLATGAAILRYRLYDLDRIISRTLQPPPLRRHPDHRRLQRPPPRAGRPGHPDRRAAGRRRPDHAAHQGVAVAATLARLPRRGASVTVQGDLNRGRWTRSAPATAPGARAADPRRAMSSVGM